MLCLDISVTLVNAFSIFIGNGDAIYISRHINHCIHVYAHSFCTVPIVTYIFNHCIHLYGVCTGSAQCLHSVCTVFIVTYIFNHCIHLYGVCTGSALCPLLHIYSITVSICMGSTQGLYRVCTGSALCLHCVCNADGAALPQFELCVTLTALPSLFKDNCRPNTDLRDWLVDWCQSKQAHKSLAR